jgi:hypothetical protein
MDGEMAITKLIVALRNFANAPKIESRNIFFSHAEGGLTGNRTQSVLGYRLDIHVK